MPLELLELYPTLQVCLRQLPRCDASFGSCYQPSWEGLELTRCVSSMEEVVVGVRGLSERERRLGF
jgi:hypothetical protein